MLLFLVVFHKDVFAHLFHALSIIQQLNDGFCLGSVYVYIIVKLILVLTGHLSLGTIQCNLWREHSVLRK